MMRKILKRIEIDRIDQYRQEISDWQAFLFIFWKNSIEYRNTFTKSTKKLAKLATSLRTMN